MKWNDFNAIYANTTVTEKFGSKNTHQKYVRTEKSIVAQHILKQIDSVDVNSTKVINNRYLNAYETLEIETNDKQIHIVH